MPHGIQYSSHDKYTVYKVRSKSGNGAGITWVSYPDSVRYIQDIQIHEIIDLDPYNKKVYQKY